MAGVRLVKRDVRPSHDVTSDRHANLAHPAARISQYDKKTRIILPFKEQRHSMYMSEGVMTSMVRFSTFTESRNEYRTMDMS